MTALLPASIWGVVLGVARLAPLGLLPPLRLIPGGRWLVLGAAALLTVPATAQRWQQLDPVAAVPGALLLRELLIGGLLALLAALPCAAAASAGLLLEGLGSSAANPTAPSSLDQGRDTPVSRLYCWLTLAIFAALAGPQLVLSAVVRSYALLPPGDGSVPLQGLLSLGAQLFTLAGMIAAPPLLSILLAQVLLLLALRIAGAGGLRGPAAPLRSLLLLLALLIGAPALPAVIQYGMGHSLGELAALLQ